jgi:hypothetical protein
MARRALSWLRSLPARGAPDLPQAGPRDFASALDHGQARAAARRGGQPVTLRQKCPLKAPSAVGLMTQLRPCALLDPFGGAYDGTPFPE